MKNVKILSLVTLALLFTACEIGVPTQKAEVVSLQQKRAKQQKLQREIEKLAGRNMSMNEVLGKEFMKRSREKFGM